MKKKNFEKKLVINKETIANLNNEQMNDIKGGTSTVPATQYVTCPVTCPRTCVYTCTVATVTCPEQTCATCVC